MWTVPLAARKQYLRIGVVLCLLAALFAIEAKLAWYAPDNAPASQISASKLLAADAPRIVAQAVAFSLLPLPYLDAIFLLALVLTAAAIEFVHRTPLGLPKPRAFDYSSSLFFRPPPIR